MSEHTPGPWSVSGLVRPAVVIGDEVIRLGAGTEEWKANARLIAAAPELLEALQNVCGLMKIRCQDRGGYYEHAMSVIAKATGEQQ